MDRPARAGGDGRIDRAALSLYLRYGNVPSPHSIYFIVPRAEAYANPETLTATRIATLDAAARRVIHEDDAGHLFQNAFDQAVQWSHRPGGPDDRCARETFTPSREQARKMARAFLDRRNAML